MLTDIPAQIPEFYSKCLKAWSLFSDSEPNTVDIIMTQTIWNNKYLKVNKNHIFIKV